MIEISRRNCTSGEIGHGVFAALSNHAYDPTVPVPLKKWELLDNSDNLIPVSERKGYFGIAYIDRTRRAIIIAHRGTELNDSHDILTDLGLVQSKYIPSSKAYFSLEMAQFKPANLFFNIIQKKYPNSEYSLHQTGHSLGAALANMIACVQEQFKSTIPTVTFESPGEHKAIFDLIGRNGNDLLLKDTLAKCPVITYLSSPNFINMVDEHVGERRQIILPAPDADMKYHTMYQHSIETIASNFETDLRCPQTFASIEEWPTGEYANYASAVLVNLLAWQSFNTIQFKSNNHKIRLFDVIDDLPRSNTNLTLFLALLVFGAALSAFCCFIRANRKKPQGLPLYYGSNQATKWWTIERAPDNQIINSDTQPLSQLDFVQSGSLRHRHGGQRI